MNYKTFHIGLRRFTIALYMYAFAMIAITYPAGYYSIVPDHANKEYPQLDGVPSVSQESIDRAVEAFEIQIPFNSLYPSLNMDMKKGILGKAQYYLLIHTCIPTIGPGAFTSWGKLGAVLAHEIEVHCNQNWWRARIDYLFSTDPTPILEREAYAYMLLDSERFHLTAQEQFDILITMLHLYPTGDEHEQGQDTKKTTKRPHGATESP